MKLILRNTNLKFEVAPSKGTELTAAASLDNTNIEYGYISSNASTRATKLFNISELNGFVWIKSPKIYKTTPFAKFWSDDATTLQSENANTQRAHVVGTVDATSGTLIPGQSNYYLIDTAIAIPEGAKCVGIMVDKEVGDYGVSDIHAYEVE